MRIIMKFGIIPLILLACGDTKNNTDSGDISDTSDTGDTETVELDPNDYDSGCFTVDGGDGFAKFRRDGTNSNHDTTNKA